ncbi:MAG TPA: class I adenylate-forming enzyme family protein [Thermoanaerobaculia bacterium]|nr:class I adenylate-forming enzyme family protein [Thermoanaerobaculia bacterium]
MLELFENLVRADANAPALIDAATGAVATRGALLRRAQSVANALAAAGLAPRDPIAVQLPNSVDFVAVFVAALLRDLVVFPIDRDANEHEVAAILRHFRIRALVGRSGIAPLPAAALPLPAAVRLVKLTSGSTGLPKGIAVSDANLLADCANICATMGIAPHDVNLGAIPFSHSYGFSNLVMPLLAQGTPVVVTNDYLPQALVDHANQHRCTVAPLIPMVFDHLARAAHGSFESVRTFISAGAPLPASTSRRFRERFGIDIHSFYGCSEAGGIAYDRRGGAVERGTVGTAMEGVSLAIDQGRLRVTSASVAEGQLPEGAAFIPFDGTFTTDDLVELRDGELSLTGRASDLINTAGKKVNPREVEAVILQIEGVREVKVYGESAGARGEVVAAAVVAAPDVTRERVREFCRARLSLHKVPRVVKLIDAMPVDERGKVKRAALTAL